MLIQPQNIMVQVVALVMKQLMLLVNTENRVGLSSNDNKPEITARNKTTHARVYEVDYLFCKRIVRTRAKVEKEKRYNFIPVKPVVANLNGQKTNVIKWV